MRRPSPEGLLDAESMLNEAERTLLLEGGDEFYFSLRRRSGLVDYYARLEVELQNQDLVSVAEYRSVREGYVRVSRPARLVMTVDSLLRRRPHLRSLVREVQVWREDFADLQIVDVALRTAFRETTANPSVTRSCFEVLSFLIQNRELIRGLLPRQVPHAESSKLIGREGLLLKIFGLWRGETATWKQFFRYFQLLERPIEFRFYAPKCVYQNAILEKFHGIISLDSARMYRFSELSGTLIVENLETFFAEAERSRDRLVIWGGGWKAVLMRSLEVEWPRPLQYWGDIDKEGYEIFGTLKTYLPDLQPTLMGMGTLKTYRQVGISKEPYLGPFRDIPGLQDEYQEVCIQGLCIEQEKIHECPYVES